MKKIIFILILFSWIPYSVHAIDNVSKKKISSAILTDDYGILNEKDLDDSMKPEPYSPKEMTGRIYWQCYSRDAVTVALRDLGYSSTDLTDNDGELSITVYSKPGISHKYGLRRNWSTPSTAIVFNRWLKLMKGEKHVCLAGRGGILLEEKTIQGKKHQEYYWSFEKLKTKRGCDSYFVPTNCA